MPGRKPKRITEEYLHNAGLYYLQKFSSSTENFRRVMLRKIKKSCCAHPDSDPAQCLEMLESLIDKFERCGLLDDDKFAAATIQTLRARGESANAISRRLQAKGIKRDAVTAALRKHDGNNGSNYESTSELAAAARYVLRRKIGPCTVKSEKRPAPAFDKGMATLARAGYSFSVAQKIMLMSENEIRDLAQVTEGCA